MLGAAPVPTAEPGAREGDSDVRPYSMHVSAKYLELTRRKLEGTRLPRVVAGEREGWAGGTPKEVLERVLDYWLEHYNWRAQEHILNATLPQYRTSLALPSPLPLASQSSSSSSSPSPISPSPRTLRIHFAHKRSLHDNATPLLFCHTWPASFIEAHKIIEALTAPQPLPGAETPIAFHVVVPSIPGFGFSDASHNAEFGATQTADAFHQLMLRLGYTTYVSHGTGWGFHICRALALAHPSHCKAIHTANPAFAAPTLRRAPGAWFKYRVARWTRGKVEKLRFGYVASEVESRKMQTMRREWDPTTSTAGLGDSRALAELHARRPQTLAFSLCDSPVGLLASLLDCLHARDERSSPSMSSSPELAPARAASPFLSASELEMQHLPPPPPPPPQQQQQQQPVQDTGARSLHPHPRPLRDDSLNGQNYDWTPSELLTWTMLHWLPGPEASLRWLRSVVLETVPSSPFATTYCDVPLGISSFRGSTTKDNNHDNSAPPMWGSAIWNVQWVRRHSQRRVKVSAAWEATDELVGDLRDFFGSIEVPGLRGAISVAGAGINM